MVRFAKVANLIYKLKNPRKKTIMEEFKKSYKKLYNDCEVIKRRKWDDLIKLRLRRVNGIVAVVVKSVERHGER